MANGGYFHHNKLSAASLRYPLGTHIRVRNMETGKSVVLQVTDRGPWSTKFSLDLSRAAFTRLGFHTKQGWGWVTVTKLPGKGKPRG